MKVLAIGHLTGKDIRPHLEARGRRPSGPGATVNAMSDINEFRAEITHMWSLVTAADQDTMDNRQLLRHQTTLLSALRETQSSMNTVLLEQGQALGGMVLAINGPQERVRGVDKRVMNVEHKIAGIDGRVTRIEERVGGLDGRLTGVQERVASLDGRLTGVEERLTGVQERLTRVEDKVTGIDQNVVAIMRHLGV
jgi:chromosome segregation ATPase